MSKIQKNTELNPWEIQETALLVYVNEESAEDDIVEAELVGLCEAAHIEPVGWIRQRVSHPTTGTFIGSGKVAEVRAHAIDAGAEVVIFDCELSGIQARNLAEAIERKVIDRTQLILDIFARRARTREGQLQVELAQLSYMMPRLMSVYTKFERQRGGIGMRGPGETKLESDRRMVRDRIGRLSDEIAEVRRHRDQQRGARRKTPYPFASIVGYTSAGKSTLMNLLAKTDVLADAMPFATLDPTTRKVDLPDGYAVYLTDTVGFIRNLPTHLVAAFRATLEEVVEADVILHVVDVSHPAWEMQHDAVVETLESLGVEGKPVLTVFNKIDAAPDPTALRALIADTPDSVAISALTGAGIPDLLQKIKSIVQEYLGLVRAMVPYDKASLIEECYRFGRVLQVDYREEGIYLEAELVASMRGMLKPYALA